MVHLITSYLVRIEDGFQADSFKKYFECESNNSPVTSVNGSQVA